MRIGAGDFGQSQPVRDLERQQVFIFAAGAVERFDRVDQLENFLSGRALGRALYPDRLAVGIDERKARVEPVAERMVCDQNSALACSTTWRNSASL